MHYISRAAVIYDTPLFVRSASVTRACDLCRSHRRLLIIEVEHPSSLSHRIKYVYTEVNACDVVSEYHGHSVVLDTTTTYGLRDPGLRNMCIFIVNPDAPERDLR